MLLLLVLKNSPSVQYTQKKDGREGLTLSRSHKLLAALAQVIGRAGTQEVIESEPIATTNGHPHVFPVAVAVVVGEAKEVPVEEGREGGREGGRDEWMDG